MKKTVLRAYARLIAEVGARVRKGQDVVIEAELDQPEFVTMVADACYHAGARKVTVTWKHQALEKLAIRRESVKTLQTVEDWERAKLQHYVDTLPCRIYLLSEDPDGLRGVSPAKMARARQGRYSVIKPYRDQMEGRYQWCIAAVPGAAWAKKVFPHETKARAVEKLWEAILHTCRVDDDPIAAWNAHNADLQSRCDHLNSLGIASLEYHASNGTNLTVGMIPEAQFCGGGEYTIGGSYFNPNLPTEECFISPKRGEAEGIVYSSKPLSYQGQLIEDFSIRFGAEAIYGLGAMTRYKFKKPGEQKDRTRGGRVYPWNYDFQAAVSYNQIGVFVKYLPTGRQLFREPGPQIDTRWTVGLCFGF